MNTAKNIISSPHVTSPLVIIPCGAAKQSHRCKAGELYVGSYHQACLTYARATTSENCIYILSAKYGLLRLFDEIEPYELRMGEPGCITREAVIYQAWKWCLMGLPVVALGGRAYVNVCRAVWPHCTTPLRGLGGMGKHIQWLRQQATQLQQVTA